MPKQIRRAAVNNMFLYRSSILSLGWYYPAGHPKADDRFSKMIIFLKRALPFAIAYFTKAIQNSFQGYRTIESCGSFYVVTVPSHDPEFVNGITKVAKQLCKVDKRFMDATEAVKRNTWADSFCKTNNRNEHTLRSTIVINPQIIKNRNILLLDDLSSSGTSLLTVEKMLLEAGAASVTPLAMAQTIAYKQ